MKNTIIALMTFFTWLWMETVVHAGLPGGLTSDQLASMAKNLLTNLGGPNNFMPLIYSFSLFVGVLLAIMGIINLTKRESSKGGAIACVMIGCCLISLKQFMDLANMTLFAKNTQSIVSAAGVDAANDSISTTAKAYIGASVLIAQIIGVLAVYRGLKTLADCAINGRQHQPEQTRAGLVFIVAGLICVNIREFLRLCSSTLGGEAAVWYGKVFGWMDTVYKS